MNEVSKSLSPAIPLKGEGVSPLLHLKADFPSLYQKDIAFLDSAASAQKPRHVIDAMTSVMTDHYANIHRGLYNYSQKTTTEFEAVRQKIRGFINAKSTNEIIFTRNATEGINLVAQCWGRAFMQSGDEVILTEMEHHANIVPWQLLRDQIGIVIKIIPILDDGSLDLGSIESLLNNKTKFISFTAVSNAMGVINDAAKIIRIVRNFNPDIKIMVDGSQSVVHFKTDVQALDCDFFAFTGHKLYGPSGIGVLWGKEDILNTMPPYQGGGDMIETVTFDKTTYKDAPSRFEAGTPAIIEAIGLGAAIDYVLNIGMNNIAAHEQALYKAARDAIGDDLTLYGDVDDKAPILSFTMTGAHHSDIGMILNQAGVAVRTGHHCCMPLMQRFGIDGTVRASFGLYNDMDDVHRLIIGLEKVRKLLE